MQTLLLVLLWFLVSLGVVALVAGYHRGSVRPIRHTGPIVSKRLSGDVAILRPTMSERNVEEGSSELRVLIDSLAASGNLRLIVDLSGTKGCCDDIAGVLMHAFALYEKRGGRVVISGVGKTWRHFLGITKLDQVFDIYETEEEAITSLGR